MVQAKAEMDQAEVTDCCCMKKGFTRATMIYSKDGFQPGEMVALVIEVDNTQCQANVKSISIAVNNRVTLKSQGHSTSDHRRFFHKTIQGVLAGNRLEG